MLSGGRTAMADAIHYDEQSRAVAVDANVTGFTRAGTSLTPRTVDQNSALPAYGFSPFSAGLSAMGQLGAASPVTFATASQQSVLGATGFTSGGAVQAGSIFAGNGSGSATADSTFHVTFDVATALTYVLSASLTGSTGAASPQVNLNFTNQAGDALFAAVSSAAAGNFSFSGTLLPGTYGVAFDVKAMNDSGTTDSLAYAITFQTAGVATQTSSTLTARAAEEAPVSVPAPPAVFSAALTMIGLSGAAFLRRRFGS
jgi:hypothetical protein